MAYPPLLDCISHFIQQDTPPPSISPYTTFDHNSAPDDVVVVDEQNRNWSGHEPSSSVPTEPTTEIDA